MNFWLILLLAVAGSFLVAFLMMTLLYICIGLAAADALSSIKAERKE